MFFKKKPKYYIDSPISMEETALKIGVLPFFSNKVKGLSVEELTRQDLLFGGNLDEGCWEWKGPVIRQKTLAYGKFFHRKAGFISLDLLPDFLNYRRVTYPVKPNSIEEMLLDIIRENEGISSTELKAFVFGKKDLQREWTDFPDALSSKNIKNTTHKTKSLESPLQRLQMGGWLLISDFEYKRTKKGERYGWGVARYTTPELNFGSLLLKSKNNSPIDSIDSIVNFVKNKFPSASKSQLFALLK